MPRGPVDLSLRCPRCLFPPAECLCPEVRPVETRTSFLLLRHASELTRPTNSGRWAALALTRCELVDYAVPAVPRPRGPRPPTGWGDGGPHRARPPDLSALAEPDTVVLFPSPRAPAPAPVPVPRRVVVLDATWAQARRMLQRVPALRALPRLGLPPDALAWASAGLDPLRKPTVEAGVSTLQAMAAALHVLGEEAPARALLALHLAAAERSWRLRRGSVERARAPAAGRALARSPA